MSLSETKNNDPFRDIDEHCKTIRRHGLNISIEQLNESFDLFVSVLKEIDISDDKCTLIEQIVFSLSTLPRRETKLAESELITHEFFVVLRDIGIIDLLRRTQMKDEINEELLSNVSHLFKNLCCSMTDTNTNHIKSLLFHKPLIDEIANCLNEIGTCRQYLKKSFILRSINDLLLAFKHFRSNEMITDEYSLITPILVGVIHCLCSSYTVNMIQNLEHNFTQTFNDSQILFLDTMPLYLQWYSADHRDSENFIKILRILLNEFTIWLTSCQPDSYLHCSYKIAAMIRHLSYFLIRPIESDNLNTMSEEFSHDYCKLALYWSSVLSSLLTQSSKKINTNLSTRIILQNFYNLSLHLNVLSFMKTISNLIPMLLRMTEVEHDEIQLNAYRCLGKIMTEDDIKTMANPDKIAAVYIDFIKNTVDDPKNVERFQSLLKSLKNFVQHDQVKTELMKQETVPLLVKCVIETRFDPINVRQIALEILLALSFNNDACFLLRQNEMFMIHLRILAGDINSNQSGLQRAAERLFWKLEKEEEAITKPANLSTYKYYIMISYSHRDQQICFQIHEQLVNDGFHVWIDRDCLRGSTMIGIANAIENSEHVLVCMSNMYKQSVYCQSEAHYAFERGCRLIPIIIEADYKPDGWLGIIVSGKIYVDFAKMNFQVAYEKLKSEINEQRYQSLNQLSIQAEENDQIEIISSNSERMDLVPESINDLPDCITLWSYNHVKLFFLKMGLDHTLLHLCTRMNGHRLLHLYEMCLINRESMYQSLKFELMERHHILLPVADYVAFLHEIKPYISSDSPNVTTSQASSPSPSFIFCNVL